MTIIMCTILFDDCPKSALANKLRKNSNKGN